MHVPAIKIVQPTCGKMSQRRISVMFVHGGLICVPIGTVRTAEPVGNGTV